MPPENPRIEGGLVLKRADIQSILNQPGTKGIAFACQAPGDCENVDLQVLKVYLDANNNFLGDVVNISPLNKKGAKGPFQYPVGNCDAFKFPYLGKLQSDGYFFGYFELFDGLFQGRDDWDELFIGGGRQIFPEGTYDHEEWFSFSISMRKGIPEYDLPDEPLFIPALEAGFPQYGHIQVPVISAGNPITSQEFRNADPAIAALPILEVDGILKIENKPHVKAILLKGGVAAVFPSEMPIGSFRMKSPNYELDLLFPLFTPFEAVDLGGGLPVGMHTIGCPPHWPSPVTDGFGSENSIKTAIENALARN